MQSLFGYLKNYIPSEGRDPKEDYLTQMFAWILSNVDGAAKIYVKNLCDKIKLNIDINTTPIDVSTQVPIKVGRNKCHIDMLIKVGNDKAFICEHKIGSQLSRKQIEKYKKNSAQLGERDYYSVLVTYSESQWTQNSDIAMIWGDVYKLFDEKIMKGELYPSESANHFVIKEFLSYLREKNMEGYKEITPEMIQLWFSSVPKYDESLKNNLKKSLKTLFVDLVSEKWNEYCPNITRKEFSEYNPTYHSRWGRLGIEFHSWKRLLVFAGVVLYTEDHGLDPADYEKGPDFCIFIDSEYGKKGPKKEQYDRNLDSEYIRKRKRVLEKDSGDFEYMPGLKSSPWRILVLRKPLLDVLKDAYDKKEQREALKKAIIEGINTMLGE